LQANKPPNKTMADVKDQRKKEMVSDMMLKFGAQTIGIHGQELPKYMHSDDSKQWWRQY